MKSIYHIIKEPLVSEKNSLITEKENKYVFRADLRANKFEIKEAIEKIFKVQVIKVRTQIMRGKVKRFQQNFAKRPNWKKVTVSLKEGDKIDLFQTK